MVNLLQLSRVLLQEEFLTTYFWQNAQQPQIDSVDKFDPSKPYFDVYRVDFDHFKTLFLALAPWCTGNHASTLALRVFRVCVYKYQYPSKCYVTTM